MADGNGKAVKTETALCHYVNGKRYTAIRGEPRHETLELYRQCVREAYGSLHGVTFGTWERPV